VFERERERERERELKNQPYLTNSKINHTLRSYFGLYEGRCKGGVEVLKKYRNALFVH
jgi:hypothetical protein